MLKKCWLALAAGVLLTLQLSGVCQAKQVLFADQAAADALLAQDYAAAQSVADDFIAKYPKNSEGYFWKGYFYKQHEENELAIVNLEKAKALNPKDWSTLENLLALYVAEDNKAKIYQTSRDCVQYYKKHKKKITAPPAAIARMYYWAGEYEAGLKLFPELQDDAELNEVRAGFCKKIAVSGKNNGSIYLAKIYTVRGLDYAPEDAELLALDKELTELIAKDKALEGAVYSGRDYHYRYYYWYHPYWFYGYYGHPHRHGRHKVFVPPPPRPHIVRPRPGVMPPPDGAIRPGGRPPAGAVRPDKPNIAPSGPQPGASKPVRPGVQVPRPPRPQLTGPRPPQPGMQRQQHHANMQRPASVQRPAGNAGVQRPQRSVNVQRPANVQRAPQQPPAMMQQRPAMQQRPRMSGARPSARRR